MVITKADGSVERFSETKLRRCLQAALRAARCETKLCEPLARAVTLHLAEWEGPAAPTSEYVYRCVRSVLKETDLEEAAEALAVHRRQRRANRRRLRVFDPAKPQRGISPWRKAAIVGWLQNNFGLRRPVARTLAAEVESRVFSLGYRVVRTTMIDEIMRNELMSWGLGEEAVGVQAGLWSKPVGSAWPARED